MKKLLTELNELKTESDVETEKEPTELQNLKLVSIYSELRKATYSSINFS